MNADEQVRAWAADRLGIPRAEVVKVEFIHYDGFHYSEYTMEEAYDGAEATLIGGSVRAFSLSGEEFGDIIREVLEVQPAPDGWAVAAEDDGQLGLVPA